MKTKLISGSIMLLITLTSVAQITINRSDIGNLIGGIIVEAHDNTNLNLLSPGNAGANQSWNFTSMGNDFQDTLKFLNPHGLSCYANFPTATVALLDSGIYEYIYDNNTTLNILGMCGKYFGADTLSVSNSPASKYFVFPSTYNTTFSGQSRAVFQYHFNAPPNDSVRIVINTSYTSLIDAWGNVTTATGTYPSLRQKITNFQIDSFFVHTTGSVWHSTGITSKDTSIEYDWWSINNPFIVTITTNWSGNVEKASYLISSNLGIHAIQPTQDAYTVFPNPSNGIFTVYINSQNYNKLEIYNVIGDKVYNSSSIKGQKTKNIDISNFSKGIYFLKIMDGDNMVKRKIILQ